MSSKRRSSLWVHADGSTEEVYPNGSKWTLVELQAKVGGFIEPVAKTYLLAGQVMLVNEEGMLNRLPENWYASMLAGRPIVGDAIVIPAEQFK